MGHEINYLEALKSAYNVIFEINTSTKLVKCIHGKDTSAIGIYYDIDMTIDSAKHFWVNNYIIEEDRAVALKYFNRIITPGELEKAKRPLQIDFRIKTRRGMFFSYLGVAVKLNDDSFLFCCRDMTDVRYSNMFKLVKITTFGYFNVQINDEAVAFSSEKAKELLAVLVDHRGSFVTGSEAVSFLWEDRPYDKQTQSNYRKVALRLKNTLREYGIENIVETKNGKRRIVPEKVQCDLFDYMNQKPGCEKLFHGSYLNEYSWAEMTKYDLEEMR